MVLNDPAMMEAEMQTCETDVTGVGSGNEDTIDNEVSLAGLWRKVRRILVENLDNALVTLYIYSGLGGGSLDVTLRYTIHLTQYQQRAFSPEDIREIAMMFLASTTEDRLSARLSALDTNGVRVRTEYFDDISP